MPKPWKRDAIIRRWSTKINIKNGTSDVMLLRNELIKITQRKLNDNRNSAQKSTWKIVEKRSNYKSHKINSPKYIKKNKSVISNMKWAAHQNYSWLRNNYKNNQRSPNTKVDIEKTKKETAVRLSDEIFK